MKRILILCGLLLCAAAESQITQTQTVPFTGTATVTIPAPIPGPAGAQGPQEVPGTNGKDGAPGAIGPAGPAGASPSVTAIEAALAADPNFVKSVAAQVGGTTPPPVVVSPPPVANIPSCTATQGALTLNAKVSRVNGISPLMVWFDATGSTDTTVSPGMTAFQDVTYTWTFGDSGTSGTGTWAYGSNPGKNSRNAATGGIAAHLYIASADTKYPVTVTASDGANKASCQLAVTAFNPAGSNGFAKTACQSSSGAPVPGSGGCPAGASVINSASESAAVSASLSNQRILFKCGDTFSGAANVGGTKFSVGAYGGCEGTTTGRPVMHGPFTIGTGTATDGRIADLDFESTGSYAVSAGFPSGRNLNGPMTLVNLKSSGNSTSYYWSQGTQWGLVDSVQAGESNIGTFVNYGENNCANLSTAAGCAFANINYQALLGNSFDGTGAPTGQAGIEVVRISACRMCVIANNTSKNANNVGATLKFHNGNTFNSLGPWTGQYTELVEVSDNAFGGTSGAQLVELSPQNSQTDERMRNFVVERNLFTAGSGNGRQVLVSAVNATLRDNVFNGTLVNPTQNIQVAQRGIEPVPQGVEIYNNTCYGGGLCVAFSGVNFAAAGTNSYAKNNLMFNSSGGAAVSNIGTGNIASNNSATSTANPGFVNASGSFGLISDFKPTANFSGGVNVPVLSDAMGAAWGPWDLGAIHH